MPEHAEMVIKQMKEALNKGEVTVKKDYLGVRE